MSEKDSLRASSLGRRSTVDTFEAQPPSYSEASVRTDQAVLVKGDTPTQWQQKPVAIDELFIEAQTPRLQIIFLNRNDIDANAQQLRRLARHFAVPQFFWQGVCERSNGYFGHRDLECKDDHITQHSSWLRFEIKQVHGEVSPQRSLDYTWDKVSLYLRCSGQSAQLLCVDAPEDFREKFLAVLRRSDGPSWCSSDPYCLYAAAVEVVTGLFDESIWKLRNHIRDIEKARENKPRRRDGWYGMMHELARHTIHSTETVQVAISSIKELVSKHQELCASASLCASQRTQQDMRSLLSFIKHQEGRSVALQSRLQNEINLLANEIAQQQTSSTLEISKATQKDSAVMRTIALVTLIFLPATFVSALFSTTFFNFTPASDNGPERWVMSQSFWVYWVFAIPLTLMVAGIWLLWHRRRQREIRMLLKANPDIVVSQE